jgi:hypothetical protein
MQLKTAILAKLKSPNDLNQLLNLEAQLRRSCKKEEIILVYILDTSNTKRKKAPSALRKKRPSRDGCTLMSYRHGTSSGSFWRDATDRHRHWTGMFENLMLAIKWVLSDRA